MKLYEKYFAVRLAVTIGVVFGVFAVLGYVSHLILG